MFDQHKLLSVDNTSAWPTGEISEEELAVFFDHKMNLSIIHPKKLYINDKSKILFEFFLQKSNPFVNSNYVILKELTYNDKLLNNSDLNNEHLPSNLHERDHCSLIKVFDINKISKDCHCEKCIYILTNYLTMNIKCTIKKKDICFQMFKLGRKRVAQDDILMNKNIINPNIIFNKDFIIFDSYYDLNKIIYQFKLDSSLAKFDNSININKESFIVNSQRNREVNSIKKFPILISFNEISNFSELSQWNFNNLKLDIGLKKDSNIKNNKILLNSNLKMVSNQFKKQRYLYSADSCHQLLKNSQISMKKKKQLIITNKTLKMMQDKNLKKNCKLISNKTNILNSIQIWPYKDSKLSHINDIKNNTKTYSDEYSNNINQLSVHLHDTFPQKLLVNQETKLINQNNIKINKERLRILKMATYLVDCLNKYGFCVIDKYFGSDKNDILLAEISLLEKGGYFGEGKVVSNDLKNSKIIRGDKTCWIENFLWHMLPNIFMLIQSIDRLIYPLSEKFNGSVIKSRTKPMIACYPGCGTKYMRHIDNPNKDGRLITCIYYFNKFWDPKIDGGTLMLFPSKILEPVYIEPIYDRLLFFWSDNRSPHEVLPAFSNRYALTVWYFDDEERRLAKTRLAKIELLQRN